MHKAEVRHGLYNSCGARRTPFLGWLIACSGPPFCLLSSLLLPGSQNGNGHGPSSNMLHIFLFVLGMCRRELKYLKDTTRERLAVEYAQKKEKVIAGLRRSLGRGAGHNINGLRGELWDDAFAQRTR